MSLVVAIQAYGAFILQIALLAAVILFAAQKFSSRNIYEKLGIDKLNRYLSRYRNELVFLQAAVATSGSLYMSNVLGWDPCIKCWMQRAIIYPAAVLALLTLILQYRGKFNSVKPGFIDDMRDYLIPLVLVGIPIALYHALEQNFAKLSTPGCSAFQVSCETVYTYYFGYITIPVMSLTAMLVILFLLWRYDDE